MHLAELNIAKPKYDNDDPRFADFMNNLERINGLAAKMPGFVWIHADESGHAMDLPNPWPDMAANLTVWESVEALEHFVWNTVHKQFYKRKAEWFNVMSEQYFVMWWVEEGHFPTLEEAKERLDYLNKYGDTDHAFGWSHVVKDTLVRNRQCA